MISNRETLVELKSMSKLNDLSNECDILFQYKEHLKRCKDNEIKFLNAQTQKSNRYISELERKENLIDAIFKNACSEKIKTLSEKLINKGGNHGRT